MNFPRKVWIRRLLRLVGKALLRLLARPIVLGLENLPERGPAILAGNHVAVMEIVMMALYSKVCVEFLGTGDIPLDPKFAWLADMYGFIPIKRGSVDRAGIKAAVSVLEHGGVLGVFPQGGIWDTSVNQTRTGTALLSHLGKAPVIPIGFGGMQGALRKITRLERPRLVMNVGQALHFDSSGENSRPDRAQLEKYAEEIIRSIVELLPEEERSPGQQVEAESFDIEISLVGENGSSENISLDSISQASRAALGRLFHYPVLLDALDRNLKLPVRTLRNLDQPIEVEALLDACHAILVYLQSNPGFFTYRFGVEQGLQVETALRELTRNLTIRLGNHSLVEIVPIYRYSDMLRGQEVEERGMRQVHSM